MGEREPFSLGCRVTLIESCLMAESLEGIMRRFLWCRWEDSKNHLVAWEKVRRPKYLTMKRGGGVENWELDF